MALKHIQNIQFTEKSKIYFCLPGLFMTLQVYVRQFSKAEALRNAMVYKDFFFLTDSPINRRPTQKVTYLFSPSLQHYQCLSFAILQQLNFNMLNVTGLNYFKLR